MLGDTSVSRLIASIFEKSVDFGLIIHKSTFMAEDKDPVLQSNYIFELWEANPGVARCLLHLHPEGVEVVVESITAHAEKDASKKTALYVGQEEEDDDEEEEEGEEEVGGWQQEGQAPPPPQH